MPEDDEKEVKTGKGLKTLSRSKLLTLLTRPSILLEQAKAGKNL